MSIITNMKEYTGITHTTLAGVEKSECTYEIFENMLILRTTTHDTIHITPSIGKELIKLIVDNIL